LKKLFLIAICLVLLFLTACGGNNNGNDDGSSPITGRAGGTDGTGGSAAGLITNGRYVENDITPPIEGQFITLQAQDGTIVVFDSLMQSRFTSHDGGDTWIESPGLEVDFGENFWGMRTAALLECGSVLVFIDGRGMVMFAPDGSYSYLPISSIDTEIADGYQIMVSQIVALGSDRLLLSYTISGFSMMGGGGRFRAGEDEDDNDEEETHVVMGFGMGDRFEQRTALYDLQSGQLVASLPEMTTSAVAIGDYFYLLSPWEGIIDSFSLASGAPSGRSTITLPRSAGGMNMVGFGFASNALAVSNDGHLLVMHENNLIQFDSGDTTTLLDGDMYSFGGPNAQVADVLALPCGRIIVGVNVGMRTILIRFDWDENATINPERTLHIWSLENNDLVRAAITDIRRRYPDTHITYEIALQEGTGISASDAIRTLNTQLLSGRGPDIIILDGTPAENYINRGMLLDMSSIVNTNGMFQNLLAPYVGAGGVIYAIPTQFFAPVLAGYAENLAAVGSLNALVNRTVSGNPPVDMSMDGRGWLGDITEDERAELGFDTLQELYDLLWLTSAPSVINNNQLDSDALRSFLSATLALSDKFELAVEQGEDAFGVMMVGSTGGRGSIISGSLISYIMRNTNMAAFSLQNVMIMGMLDTNRLGTEMRNFPGLTSGVWEPSTVVGISADTAVAGFAAEFINTMLSLNVQQIDYGAGLPITPAGLDAQFQVINDRNIEFGMDPIDIDTDSFIATLTTPVMVELVLRDMIWEVVERLCYGRIDMEGAVREIEQSIRNYLAERA